MHARNKYKEHTPNFAELAKQRPSLLPHLIQRTSNYFTINFKEPSALRELSCALLEQDFNLTLDIPLDRLIPRVPLRLNYVHWIEDLLMEDGVIPSGSGVCGIDIGTGASCIYPLLGTRLNGWNFLATEIDPVSIEYATKNVATNNFSNNITIQKVEATNVLVGVLDDKTSYDFCMCNPPFFKDTMERDGVNKKHQVELSGADHEVITEGGEVQFVKRIISDSLKLRSKIRWYTSMLGKKSSVKELCNLIKHHQIPVLTTTEFVQGNVHRWGIAWSFNESERSKVASFGGKKDKLYLLQLPDSFTTHEQTTTWLTEQFTKLEISWSVIANEDDDHQTITCKATKKTWANQRRKRRLATQHQQTVAKRMKEEYEETCKQDNISSSIIPQEIHVNPCHLEFICITSRDCMAKVQFKYLLGDSKDDLHQIIQYLKNQLTLLYKLDQHTVHNKQQQQQH
ncbi:RNA N6-adenosine-methyltransferase mettl16-like isoform X2 [Dysidea avara]|uniref:RNA N6-adenosine-methyltransferase mettl16-like isoform X2 n=1 Tax=Dysidea avara TaxID=196820 RepID=UPI00332750B7